MKHERYKIQRLHTFLSRGNEIQRGFADHSGTGIF